MADEVHIVIETENVIAAVRARRELWDPAHDLYTGKEARRRAWRDICRTLMPDWDKFDEQDQNDIERKVQQRWRTARDCFVKARAARVTPRALATRRENALRYYSHYDRLSFLEETLRTPPGAVSVPRTRRRRRHRPPPGGAEIEAPPAAEEAGDDSALSVFERRLLATLRARGGGGDSPLETDDEHFFRSLAPMLAVLDNSQKLEFRSSVLDILQRQYSDHTATYNYVTVDEHRNDDDDDPPDKKYRPPSARDDIASDQ